LVCQFLVCIDNFKIFAEYVNVTEKNLEAILVVGKKIGLEVVRKGRSKGRFHPRTGHEGLEGEQRYRYTLSLTSELDGGRWSTPRPSHPGLSKDPVSVAQEAGWASGPVWKGAERPGIRCTGGWMGLRAGLEGRGKPQTHRVQWPVSHPVASRYTFCAVPCLANRMQDKFTTWR